MLLFRGWFTGGMFLYFAASFSLFALSIQPTDPAYFQETVEIPAGQPKAGREGSLLRVVLANGCRLLLETETLQMRAETAEGVTLLDHAPGRILQLAYLPAGLGEEVRPIPAEARLRFERLAYFGEAAIFHFTVISADGKESRLEWTFLPIRMMLNGKSLEGVGDTFLFDDPFHLLHEVTLFGLAATGEEYAGARSFRLACYTAEHGYREAVFGGTPKNLGWWGAFIDGGQLFHVVGHRKGTLVEYLDDECHDMTLLGSNGANNAVEITHRILIGRVPALYRTPMRVRLFTTEPLSLQLWMELTRSRRQYFARKYGISPTPIRPIFVDRNFFYRMTFDEYAGTRLSLIRDMGFRRIEIGWIYRRGIAPAQGQAWPTEAQTDFDGKVQNWRGYQTEYKDTLTDLGGGPEGIRRLVDRAHELGMEVYAWHQMAHGWRGAEEVRHHPDWVVHTPDGRIFAGSYPHCLVFFDLRSGFREHTLGRIAEIKRQTHLDGFWLDMYGSGLWQSPNYLHLVASPSVAERMDYLRRMREMGLGLYGEGISSVVIDSFELQDDPNWNGKEPILYGTGPFLWKIPVFDKLDLFKLLSVQCIPTGPAVLPPGESEADRERLARIRYRNRCFNLIEDHLGQPLGVRLAPYGAEWIHPGGNALFFYEPTRAEVVLPGSRVVVRAISPEGDVAIRRGNGTVTADMPARSLMVIQRAASVP